MMGLSELSDNDSEDRRAKRAVVEAERVSAMIDDDVTPSPNAILQEMGRTPDGTPLPDGPRGITAVQAARRLLDRGET